METSQADDDGGRKASVDADKSLDQISAYIAQMISGMLLHQPRDYTSPIQPCWQILDKTSRYISMWNVYVARCSGPRI